MAAISALTATDIFVCVSVPRALTRNAWSLSQQNLAPTSSLFWVSALQHWNCNTLATWWEELTNWKRPWCWERQKAGVEGDNRGWDGWMASPAQWIWVLANSGSWWWTGRCGALQSMGSQRVEHHWATELNRVDFGLNFVKILCCCFVVFATFKSFNA